MWVIGTFNFSFSRQVTSYPRVGLSFAFFSFSTVAFGESRECTRFDHQMWVASVHAIAYVLSFQHVDCLDCLDALSCLHPSATISGARQKFYERKPKYFFRLWTKRWRRARFSTTIMISIGCGLLLSSWVGGATFYVASLLFTLNFITQFHRLISNMKHRLAP